MIRRTDPGFALADASNDVNFIKYYPVSPPSLLLFPMFSTRLSFLQGASSIKAQTSPFLRRSCCSETQRSGWASQQGTYTRLKVPVLPIHCRSPNNKCSMPFGRGLASYFERFENPFLMSNSGKVATFVTMLTQR
jgi:hypothetical protein